MEINESSEGKWSILQIDGWVNNATAPELEKKLLPMIKQGSASIIIDLSDVSYISSVGVRVLMMAAKEMQTSGGEIVLCGLSQGLEEFFEMSGLSEVFRIEADRANVIGS